MEDIGHEVSILERRYKRLVSFDQWLCGIYALTATIPGYFLFTTPLFRGFHFSGVAAIMLVAYFGWRADSRLLKGERNSTESGFRFPEMPARRLNRETGSLTPWLLQPPQPIPPRRDGGAETIGKET